MTGSRSGPADEPRERARQFFGAIRAGDRDRLRELAIADPDLVFAIDPDGCCGGTVMNAAVGLGDLDLLETLLELGADPNQPSAWPPGPFRALHSIPDRHLDTVGPWLLERGAALDAHAAAKLGMTDALVALLDADPDALHRPGPDGQRPLHAARTPEIADLLLDRGAAIEARCIDHASTPAEYAATSRPDVCRFLLDRGARGDEFMYAMIGDLERLDAAIEEDPRVVHARATPDRFTPTEGEAAHIYMYSIGSGATLLHAAAVRGPGDVLELLLELGADPNARGGYDDQTPMHGAAWENRADAIRSLAAAGGDVDRPSGRIHRTPPLTWAIINGSLEAVQALIETGVTVEEGHLDAARAGIAGEFRAWSASGPERYEAILARLRDAVPPV